MEVGIALICRSDEVTELLFVLGRERPFVFRGVLHSHELDLVVFEEPRVHQHVILVSFELFLCHPFNRQGHL